MQRKLLQKERINLRKSIVLYWMNIEKMGVGRLLGLLGLFV